MKEVFQDDKRVKCHRNQGSWVCEGQNTGARSTYRRLKTGVSDYQDEREVPNEYPIQSVTLVTNSSECREEVGNYGLALACGSQTV